MKTKWIILLLLVGLVFFALGCYADAVPVQGFGAVVLIPGLFGLCEKIWPEEDEVVAAK